MPVFSLIWVRSVACARLEGTSVSAVEFFSRIEEEKLAAAEGRAKEATRGVSGDMGTTLEKAKDVAQVGSEWATQMARAAGDKVRGAVDKAAAHTQQAAGWHR